MFCFSVWLLRQVFSYIRYRYHRYAAQNEFYRRGSDSSDLPKAYIARDIYCSDQYLRNSRSEISCDNKCGISNKNYVSSKSSIEPSPQQIKKCKSNSSLKRASLIKSESFNERIKCSTQRRAICAEADRREISQEKKKFRKMNSELAIRLGIDTFNYGNIDSDLETLNELDIFHSPGHKPGRPRVRRSVPQESSKFRQLERKETLTRSRPAFFEYSKKTSNV